MAGAGASALLDSKDNDHVIDAVRYVLLAWEQANLDQVGEETVSPIPVLTAPAFI